MLSYFRLSQWMVKIYLKDLLSQGTFSFLVCFFFLLICLFFIAVFSTPVFRNPFFYYEWFLFLSSTYCSISFLSHPLFFLSYTIKSSVCFYRSRSDYFFLLSVCFFLNPDYSWQYSSDSSSSLDLLQMWPGLDLESSLLIDLFFVFFLIITCIFTSFNYVNSEHYKASSVP